jgi:ATP/ADP translocase
MKRLAESLFGLQPGERGTALLLAAYHFLLLFCLYLLKPVRDGQFLADRGTAELPFVFVLVTVATIPASLFQRHLGRRYRLDRLTNMLTLGHGSVLLGVSALVWADLPGRTYATYVYVSIYGMLATSQFWLFAGELLTSSQSKRTFALLNLGGILGAIAGGECTGWVLDQDLLAPAGLLGVAVVTLFGTVPLVMGIRAYHEHQSHRAEGGGEAASEGGTGPPGAEGMLRRLRQTVRQYPLVGWIAALVGLLSLVSTVLDYQFKTIAATAITGEAQLTAFLGHFYGRVSLVAFGLQLLMSLGVRRYVRSTSVLWLLPGALALGTTALMAVPGLAAATLLRGADQSLKHSLDKTGRELLFVPLPTAVKRRLKVPLDLGVDQGAYGLGGVLLLGLVSGLGLKAPDLGVLVLGLIVVWVGVVVGARRAYLQQFRDGLAAALHRQQGGGDGRAAADAEAASLPAIAPGVTTGLQTTEALPASADAARASADRDRALRHGGRYLAWSQLLALKTGHPPPQEARPDPTQLPDEQTLRARRQHALADLFDVLIDWVPRESDCTAEDLRLAYAGLRHTDPAVRGDAVALLDGVLSGSLRRRLVPLLNDPDGRNTLATAPPLYRFLLDGQRERQDAPRTKRWARSLAPTPSLDNNI